MVKSEARATRAETRRREEAARNAAAAEAEPEAALKPIAVPQTKLFVLYLYGGKPRKGSFRQWLRKLTQNGMETVVVDTRDGGESHNCLLPQVAK